MKLHKTILFFSILLLLKPSLVMAKPIMQETSNFRTKFGTNWETVLEDILKASEKAPCSVCGPASGKTRGLSPIHKYFDDLDYYLTHFVNKPGANNLNHWILGKGVNTPTVTINNWSEVNQTLDYLKKKQIHNKTDIEFGKKFQPTAGNSSRKSDLYYKDGDNVFHKEFKNAEITSLSNQRVGQVLGQYSAFSRISSLAEYKWIAVLGKNEGKLTDIKTLWKQAFIDNAENIYKTISKPLDIYVNVMLADNSIVNLYRKTAQNVTGFPLINGLRVLKSPKIAILKQLRNDFPDYPDKDNYKNNFGILNTSDYNNAITTYEEQYKTKAKGGAFTLDLLKNRHTELAEGGFTFKRFEGTIPDIETQHKLDLLFENEDGLIRSIEVKNWANANNVGYTQFKAYIASGNEFRYYYNGTQEAMKTKFQNVFLDNLDDWRIDPTIGEEKLKALFEVNNYNEIIDIVNDINHDFYNKIIR